MVAIKYFIDDSNMRHLNYLVLRNNVLFGCSVSTVNSLWKLTFGVNELTLHNRPNKAAFSWLMQGYE